MSRSYHPSSYLQEEGKAVHAYMETEIQMSDCYKLCRLLCVGQIRITFFSFCVQVLLHYQSVSEPAVVRKLISVLNKSSGELMKKKPRYPVVDAHEYI